jgi:hypothetical protein
VDFPGLLAHENSDTLTNETKKIISKTLETKFSFFLTTIANGIKDIKSKEIAIFSDFDKLLFSNFDISGDAFQVVVGER